MKKTFASVAAAAVLLAGTAGVGAVAGASTSAAAQPDLVGLCTNTKNGGYLRMLEAKNLPKSRWGKCRKNEAKVLVPTSTQKLPRGIDRPFTLNLGGTAYACTWKAASNTLACATPAS